MQWSQSPQRVFCYSNYLLTSYLIKRKNQVSIPSTGLLLFEYIFHKNYKRNFQMSQSPQRVFCYSNSDLILLYAYCCATYFVSIPSTGLLLFEYEYRRSTHTCTHNRSQSPQRVFCYSNTAKLVVIEVVGYGTSQSPQRVFCYSNNIIECIITVPVLVPCLNPLNGSFVIRIL